jgi:Fe-S-cluster-containing hydrogenase component 2
MPIQVREGRFDVLVIAAPGVRRWPGLGVRALATLCAEMDLSVGVFGGEGLKVKGVLPSSGTGGVALVEDSQGRVHRVEGRALVRVVEPTGFPDPFEGWLSSALLPLETALQLRKQGQTIWSPAVAILGTGNRALMLGAELLESGVPEVFCIDRPGAPFAGWEVHRRRFEMLGGRLLFGTPAKLSKAARMLWDFRIQDEHGIRVLEVAWVVAAGPFSKSEGVREFPPESLLFEMEQSSAASVAEDPEGWALEEQRGRSLGVKICKALSSDWTDRRAKKEQLEDELRRSRQQLRRTLKRREQPFALEFFGKWTAGASIRAIREFAGVPKHDHQARAVASIECVEGVECSICQSACPDAAIQISRDLGRFLDESRCTACGKCLDACPAKIPVLIQEPDGHPTAQLTLLYRGRLGFRQNELAVLLNRRGDALGSGKILESVEVSAAGDAVGSVLEHRVRVEVPAHLAWEARGLRKAGEAPSHEEEWVMSSERSASTKVEVLLRNDKRLLRNGQPLALALFETGLARAEDRLMCRDGSCGLCEVEVDGVTRLACRTQVHRGMAVQLDPPSARSQPQDDSGMLCPCLGITRDDVLARAREGKLSSPDAIRQACGIGEGRCRGRICTEPFRRILLEEGVAAEQWIDWRFPWSEWTLSV